MIKKVYLLVGIAVTIIGISAGIYWYLQKSKTATFPETAELTQETEHLSQDISELETVAEDKNLNTLEEDLSALSGETPLEQELPPTPSIDISEVESLESELSAELDGISNDLTDLKGFEGDASLDNLDASLSGLTE